LLKLSAASRTDARLVHLMLGGRQVRRTNLKRGLGLLELLGRDQVGILVVQLLGAVQVRCAWSRLALACTAAAPAVE
jgi:hypothetical protein